MNILLLDGLPEEYAGTPLSTDFRNMIQVDLILHDPDLSPSEKTFTALNQLYPEMPPDISVAIEGLAWFFGRGESEKDGSKKASKKPSKKGFDFEQDANIIFAAFYATYGLSLSTIDYLHWWEFMALFEGLPETTLIQRIIYWRTADLSELKGEELKHVKKMRGIFALKAPEQALLAPGEIDQQTKARVAQRFAEAQQQLAAK